MPSVDRQWRPTAPLENLRLRARVLTSVRAFFAERDVLEVETPLLSGAASTAPHLASFETGYRGPHAPAGTKLYLQTSPEFAMKRLLAAGSGPIYQICKAFRNEEAGKLHNPEFTMLEWYRPGFDYHALMDEVELLLGSLLNRSRVERLSYREVFVEQLGIDPFVTDIARLKKCLDDHDIVYSDIGNELDDWLSLVFTHLIEPNLESAFIYDFPVSQAMLARVRDDEPPVAERFELYVNGVELANGFFELGDGREQRRRFEEELAQRSLMSLPAVPLDEALVEALDQGFPECSGVAVGIDRLLMLIGQAERLEEVIAFPISIA